MHEIALANIRSARKRASTEDIKKGLSPKAKALHPDVNKAPGAAEQFIEVTEAYLYLTERRYTKAY